MGLPKRVCKSANRLIGSNNINDVIYIHQIAYLTSE